jgi:hypothetical protein
VAITVTISAAAKAAAAARLVDPSSAFLQAKYVVFVDAAATPVRFVAGTNTPTAAANVFTMVATGTCPVGVTTPIGGTTGAGDGSTANALAYVIGDVGTYSIASLTDAQALAAGPWATFANYIIATVVAGVVGDQLSVTTADDVKAKSVTITI